MVEKGYLLGGRYKILRLLGEGGMANVYLAEDIILCKKVAVKLLRLDLQKDPQTIHRFKLEAQSTSELSHPNIVSILDVGSDDQRHYLVMEYVEGIDLEEYIQRNKPLSLNEAIRIMDQVLSAIICAHQHGVIHRDLKPQNILMDKMGNIKIVDFGIAVALNKSTMTQTNTAIGSVHYMSPEQARGSITTKQSDIYSLGIILYELIMGQVPFGGENAVAVALKHFQEPTPSMRQQNIEIPQPLENVVMRATAKDARDRYKSVVEMKKDLDTSLEPSRRFEPPFVAEHNPNKDATIVLPVVDGSVKNTAEIKQNLKDSNKNSAWLSNFKKHKWWWITTAFAFMMIILIFIFALGRKDYVKVPELNNLDEMQAKRVLISRGLRVGKIYHKFSSKIKNNHVINVTPKSGTSIKKYQKVNLIISKGDGLTAVPNVIYEYFEDAQEELQDLGFKVIKKEIHSSTVEKGVVVEQNLFPGKKVVADKTKIVLTVSKGGKTHKKIKLRDLTGYSLKSLKDYIKDKGLILKVIEEDSSAPQGTAIRQDPEAGTKLSRGDCVTVVVSRDNGNILIKKYDIRYDSSSDRGNGNHIQVFISDDSHKFSNTYVDTYITTDKTISVPLDFSSSDEARVRIVQDGKIIVDEDVRK